MNNIEENKELYKLILKAVDGNMEATFKIILKFEDLINSEAKINGKFNQECKDYIIDNLIKYIKKFKKIKKI